MNKIVKLTSLFVLAYSFSSANMTFQKVTKVGTLQQKVIYASPKYKVKRTNGQVKAYVKMIARWGVHVYEVGVSEYHCSASNYCTFEQWISLSFYELCNIKGREAQCKGKLRGGDNRSFDYNYSTKGYFDTHEKEFEREVKNPFGDYDFPERGSEYWEYPSNLF